MSAFLGLSINQYQAFPTGVIQIIGTTQTGDLSKRMKKLYICTCYFLRNWNTGVQG